MKIIHFIIISEKLELYSSNRRNKIINQVRRPFLEEGTSHSRNNTLVNNIIEDDPITEPSLTNSIKSQPNQFVVTPDITIILIEMIMNPI